MNKTKFSFNLKHVISASVFMAALLPIAAEAQNFTQKPVSQVVIQTTRLQPNAALRGETLSDLIQKNRIRVQSLQKTGSGLSQAKDIISKQSTRPQGGNSGGGGDAIRLESGATVLLDFYEAKERYNLTPKPPAGATLDQKVESLFRRLGETDPVRANLYRKWYSTFFAEAGILKNKKATDLPDEGGVFICQRCEAFQMVVQKEIDPPVSPYRYYIVESVWDSLAMDQQAYTVVHELMLRELRLSADIKVTEELRYLNALLISDSLKQMSLIDYGKLLKKFGFTFRSNNQGYIIRLGRIQITDDILLLYSDLDFQIGPLKDTYSPEYGVGMPLTEQDEVFQGIYTTCGPVDCLTYVTHRTQLNLLGDLLRTQYPNFQVGQRFSSWVDTIVVKHSKESLLNWKSVLILTENGNLDATSSKNSLHGFISRGRNTLKRFGPLLNPVGYEQTDVIFDGTYHVAYFLKREDKSLVTDFCFGDDTTSSPIPAEFVQGGSSCDKFGIRFDLQGAGKILTLQSDYTVGDYQDYVHYFSTYKMDKIKEYSISTMAYSGPDRPTTRLYVKSENETETFEELFRSPYYSGAGKNGIQFKVVCDGQKHIVFNRRLQLNSCTLAEDVKVPYVNIAESSQLKYRKVKKGEVLVLGSDVDFGN